MIKTSVSIVAAVLIGLLSLITVAKSVHVVQYGWTSSSFDIHAGKNIFESRCLRCHAISGRSTVIGPNLSGIAALAGKRRPGMSGAAYMLESIMQPAAFKAPGSSGEMPKNLVSSYGDADVRNLVAYLNSLGGSGNDHEVRDLVIERPALELDRQPLNHEQVLRGELLYRGKAGCANCHPFYGGPEFELVAPHLFYRGYSDIRELRRAVTEPHAAIAGKYKQTAIAMTDGKVIIGMVIHRSASNISVLVSDKGVMSYRDISIDEVEMDDDSLPMIKKTEMSAMPSGIESLLSSEELDALLAFLVSLN